MLSSERFQTRSHPGFPIDCVPGNLIRFRGPKRGSFRLLRGLLPSPLLTEPRRSCALADWIGALCNCPEKANLLSAVARPCHQLIADLPTTEATNWLGQSQHSR